VSRCRMFQKTVTILLLLSASFAQGDSRSDWTQFRGPEGRGVTSSSLALEWSGSNHVEWTSSVPGAGWSSPVVANDRVWLTTAVYPDQERPLGFQAGARSMGTFRQAADDLKMTEFKVICLDLNSGKTLWSATPSKAIPAFGIHPSNTFATETPVTDGEHVFAYFAAAGEVSCLSRDGDLVWKSTTGKYGFGNGFGSGSGLAISDGLVFVQCDNDDSSYVVALDTVTGEERWKKDRDTRTSWSTPLLWQSGYGSHLVIAGAGHVAGYNPADGELLWKLNGFSGSFSGSPAWDGDYLFFGNSGPRSTGPLIAVKGNASGELTMTRNQAKDWAIWSKSGAGPGLASPVAHQGLLYVINGSVLKCYQGSTGKRLYEERLPGAGRMAASLLIAGDYLYALDEDGRTFVVKTGPEFECVSVNKIDDLFWSTPSVAGERLLLRGADRLYCIK
jgi:outer membrane protein assembly factor BamB